MLSPWTRRQLRSELTAAPPGHQGLQATAGGPGFAEARAVRCHASISWRWFGLILAERESADRTRGSKQARYRSMLNEEATGNTDTTSKTQTILNISLPQNLDRAANARDSPCLRVNLGAVLRDRRLGGGWGCCFCCCNYCFLSSCSSSSYFCSLFPSCFLSFCLPVVSCLTVTSCRSLSCLFLLSFPLD